MKFIYNNKEYNFPTSLSQITLRQRIDFDKLYLKEIEDFQNEIFKKDKDENVIEVDEVDEILFTSFVASRNLSFFSGIPVNEVEDNIPIEDVLNIFNSCFKAIYENQVIEINSEGYLWNNEIWKIEQPKLSYESKITFNELIVAKQIVKQMQDLSLGNWVAMVHLAVIFLKKENEVFEESWLASKSKRLEMMYDLPMDIALSIGFFLQNSMNLYTKTSLFSEVEE